ncbi:MAG: hypothetical protein VKI81_02700 [Synechococcaceae cyanobacterium]|nr:hypothetical protein [Synechococcaceae cyanobacterium]
MTQIDREPVVLGQANGPDVELIVSGNPLYATYQTPSGYSAIYDDQLGLYCYARLRDGEFVSTGTSIAEQPPPDLSPQLQESDRVRARKAGERAAERSRQTHHPPAGSDSR